MVLNGFKWLTMHFKQNFIYLFFFLKKNVENDPVCTTPQVLNFPHFLAAKAVRLSRAH